MWLRSWSLNSFLMSKQHFLIMLTENKLASPLAHMKKKMCNGESVSDSTYLFDDGKWHEEYDTVLIFCGSISPLVLHECRSNLSPDDDHQLSMNDTADLQNNDKNVEHTAHSIALEE